MTHLTELIERIAGISAGVFLIVLVAMVPIMAVAEFAPPWWEVVFLGAAYLILGSGLMLFFTAALHALLSLSQDQK